jgi:hypothetical protein
LVSPLNSSLAPGARLFITVTLPWDFCRVSGHYTGIDGT